MIASYILDRWAVNATMDPTNCSAILDFNVPGKPNPPPIQLTATVWIFVQYLRSGTAERYAIEFTDPSGELASPSVPLNAWVQSENAVKKFDTGTPPENCIEGSTVLFKDMHDGDSKQVTLSGNALTIAPFDSDDRLSTSVCNSAFSR